MRYGQEQINQAEAMIPEGGGVIPSKAAEVFRDTRSREPYTVYDSIVIGPGAQQLDAGFFNSWAQFANGNAQWFRVRSSSVPKYLTNKFFDTLDWAFDIHLIRCEFIAPVGFASFDTQLNDSLVFPTLFCNALPNAMMASFTVMQSDPILKIPFSHMPSGVGNMNALVAAAPAPVTLGGTQGQANVGNGYILPEGIMLAAKSSFLCDADVGIPLKTTLQPYTASPGQSDLPVSGDITSALPKWYYIRISLIGERYLQLRGARSRV